MKRNDTWDRAGQQWRNYRVPQPRRVHAPVGESLGIKVFDADIRACRCHGVHICPSTAQRAPRLTAGTAPEASATAENTKREPTHPHAGSLPWADAQVRAGKTVRVSMCPCRTGGDAGTEFKLGENGSLMIRFRGESEWLPNGPLSDHQAFVTGLSWFKHRFEVVEDFTGELDWHQAKEAMRAGHSVCEFRSAGWRWRYTCERFEASQDGGCWKHSSSFNRDEPPSHMGRFRVVEAS